MAQTDALATTRSASKKDKTLIIHHGRRLKHARLLKGYTLKQLAERVECSESMISKLENSRLSPSLAMLHRIAAELETTTAELLIQPDDVDERHDVVLFPARRFPGANGDGDGEVKVWFDRILPLDKTGLLQVNLLHLLAGAEQPRFLAHEGEEFIYVLEGAMDVIFPDKSYTVSAGEGIYFASTRDHRYKNHGEATARALWVNTPPTM
jgi:transcriptional regulator with XRE-family HTH domain